jgi:serine/threonine-protein kinase HipA
MANVIGFSTQKAENLVLEMLRKVDSVIDQVSKNLPPEFPMDISEPILQGMHSLARQQLKS